MTSPEVSHGRGGAGNINPDDTKYVDGEIVREGTPGSHGDGAFSTGRGGGGNIGDAGKPASVRHDKDVVPEAAQLPPQNVDRHVGRGGSANVHLAPEHQAHKKQADAAPHPESAQQTSLADKLKSKVMGVFKK
ncbi:uncharacterized protein BCR38DRAFT_429514 [Pseudomassariella vexata]|uniref:Uncharacterized protein n=1 Tax=Pseudomassariella vexata TaxID=1141098 RepID=A0A1Y2E3R7_9PEZI|nr:uncharacterized protein BCR38DRAFT_429514 [Pseudomassariella vexata]ORY66191.1 hypothetical protein BCR38DRAFT_429514 [Pseudomassariella vexata]